jgi:hypothetical protein
MATKPTPQAAGDTTTEYQIWYDAPDGVRRSMNATDQAGVQQIIADLHAEDDRRQLSAQSVGLTIDPHDYNVTVTEVTTTTTPVQP